MVNMPKQNGRKNKIKIDSYDVHIYPIQFQLYDKESFWALNTIKKVLYIVMHAFYVFL
jgi:hypothetical protein